jgi:hypothetical protein
MLLCVQPVTVRQVYTVNTACDQYWGAGIVFGKGGAIADEAGEC